MVVTEAAGIWGPGWAGATKLAHSDAAGNAHCRLGAQLGLLA